MSEKETTHEELCRLAKEKIKQVVSDMSVPVETTIESLKELGEFCVETANGIEGSIDR